MASNRITIKGVLTGDYSFERPAYVYGMETVTIYKIAGEDGKTYVWKTTASLGMQFEVPFETVGAYLYDSEKRKAWAWQCAEKGDTVTITATVKAETLFLLKDRQVAPAPIIRDGTGWIEERRDDDAESAVRLPDAPTCSRDDT